MGNYYRVYLRTDLDDLFRGLVEERSEEQSRRVAFNEVIVDFVEQGLEGRTRKGEIAQAEEDGRAHRRALRQGR